MKKKLMMMAAAVAVAFGAWAETETVGGYTWTYRLNGGTAEIYNGNSSAAISPSPTGAVTIPSTLGGKSVTSIGDYALYNCSGLKSVTIPDSVTSIGECAFYHCEWMTNVTFGRGVKSIGFQAFHLCSELANMTFMGNAPASGDEMRYGPIGGCVIEGSVVHVPYGSTGWGVDIPGTWRGFKIEYIEGGEPSSPITHGESFIANGGMVYAGGVDTSYVKAQTIDGALCKDGALVGTVQVKIGKADKKGNVKVSGTATLLEDGTAKKVTAIGVKVDVAATSAAIPFKAPIGEMAFEMATDGTFTLKNDSYVMAEASVGGGWSKAGAMVHVDADGASGDRALPAGTIEELLPDGEPVIPNSGKWSFAKAANVKYVKDKATNEFRLVIDDTKGTNRSAMKLTYTPKTGIFKGAFKLYAIQDGKLKKFKVKVIGMVVDGKGQGRATGPDGVSFAVTVE